MIPFCLALPNKQVKIKVYKLCCPNNVCRKRNQRILSHFETSEMRKSRELRGASPPGPLPRHCPGPVEGLLTASPDPSCFRQRPLAIACVPSGRHVHIEQQDTIFKNFLHAPEKNPPLFFGAGAATATIRSNLDLNMQNYSIELRPK